jgi:transposase, IS30 family
VGASVGRSEGLTVEPARGLYRQPLRAGKKLALRWTIEAVWLMNETQHRITLQEREEISRGLALKESGVVIGKRLGRDPSVINREISRHGGRQKYRATEAEQQAKRRPHSAATNKLNNPLLLAEVRALLETGASPMQIDVALQLAHGPDLNRRVSHETIYDFIYVHSKGQLRKDLIALLRRKKPRRSPAPKARTKLSGQLPGAVNIGARPPEVALREVPGHWEADLVMGAGNRTALLVAVERTTRYVRIVLLPAKDTATVCRNLIRILKCLPAHLRKTLTYDNGREMAAHASFTLKANMQVYFCDPHSPWQRGLVENTNGLIREYFPKGIDFNDVTKGAVAKVEWKLNNRPRVALGGRTPASALNILIQKTCALAA